MAQPQRPGGFDMNRVTTGQKILLVAGLILFIDLFLPWQGVDVGEFGEALGISGNVSGFNGLGILVALLVIVMLVWEGLLAAGVSIPLGTTSPALIGAGIAGATALFTLIAFLTKLSAIKYGAFIGLILALVIAYGAYVRFQESKVTTPPPPMA
jgi:formate hydrogenlyase subunit 4